MTRPRRETLPGRPTDSGDRGLGLRTERVTRIELALTQVRWRARLPMSDRDQPDSPPGRARNGHGLWGLFRADAADGEDLGGGAAYFHHSLDDESRTGEGAQQVSEREVGCADFGPYSA
jgi:hypothetical protein